MNNLKLEKLDDLIYAEGFMIENLGKNDISLISNSYLKFMNEHAKIIKNQPELFLYDYRQPIEDNKNILNPAIQAHDSQLKEIIFNEHQLTLSGQGTSYMNYKDYQFEMNFNQPKNIKIIQSAYDYFEKKEEKELSLNDFSEKMNHLFFRESFLCDKGINFIFIDYVNENIEKEKRNILVLSFEYEKCFINCNAKIKNQKKP